MSEEKRANARPCRVLPPVCCGTVRNWRADTHSQACYNRLKRENAVPGTAVSLSLVGRKRENLERALDAAGTPVHVIETARCLRRIPRPVHTSYIAFIACRVQRAREEKGGESCRVRPPTNSTSVYFYSELVCAHCTGRGYKPYVRISADFSREQCASRDFWFLIFHFSLFARIGERWSTHWTASS